MKTSFALPRHTENDAVGGAGGRGRVEEGRYGQQGGAARQAAGEAVSGVGHPVHSQSSETSKSCSDLERGIRGLPAFLESSRSVKIL